MTWANVCDDSEMRTYLAWLAARNRFDRRTWVVPTRLSGGLRTGVSAPTPQQATFTPITTLQIDLFCVPLQISTEKLLANHNGGSARVISVGADHSASRSRLASAPG